MIDMAIIKPDAEVNMSRIHLLLIIYSMFYIFCFKSSGIVDRKIYNNIADANSETHTVVSESNYYNTAVIDMNSVYGISEDDASILCRTVLGEKGDITDFDIGYRCTAAIEYNGGQYYVVTVSWLVDDRYWSYIGEVMVASNGDTIYSGYSDQEGNYYLHEIIWKNP